MRSKNARISGEWELTDLTLEENEDNDSDLYTYDDGTITYTYTSSDGTVGTETFKYEQELKMDKDGTYEMCDYQ